MRLYDKSAGVAVSEWRNALQTSQPHQLKPLLYVANEVLQNSKRNRGTKFLEAFSPILGQSLIIMCQRDSSIVEDVRRTAKIWGDRRVFSIRFVNELLQGLEPYRQREPEPEHASFSPEAEDPKEEEPPTKATPDKEAPSLATDEDEKPASLDSDDDDLGFGDIPGSLGHLDLDLNIQSTSFKSPPSSKKRRRNSSLGSASKRRRSILSTSSLMELWNQVASLQEGLESSQSLLRDMCAPPPHEVDQLVGDELLAEYQRVVKAQKVVRQQKHTIHSIAKERKSLEGQAVKYISWLEAALKTDQDDIVFCEDLEKKIKLIQHVHQQAREARDERRRQEALEREKEEEERRKKEEEDERRKFMESAMKRESEAKPGMVWSRDRQEYVYLNTEESWRD